MGTATPQLPGLSFAKITFCILLLALAALPGSSSVDTYAGVWHSSQGPDTQTEDYSSAATGAVESWAASGYGRQNTVPKTIFFGDARSSASYGQLTAYAHADLTQDDIWATHHLSIATATFADRLTVNAAGQSSGYLQYVFDLDGGIVGSSPNAVAAAELTIGHDDAVERFEASTSGQFVSAYMPITFGQAFQLTATLQAYVAMVSESAPFVGDVTVDFSRGARLAGLNVFDSNYGQISSFALMSDSGFDYSSEIAASAAVPEPASFLVLAAGLSGLAGRLRKRK